MNLRIRLALTLAFLGICGALVIWFASDDPVRVAEGAGGNATSASATDDRFRWQSSRQCQECHQDVWNEWFGSHHQISFLNPEVALQSEDFRKTECRACHLPQQVAVTGFAQRALPRQTRPDEGVDCITCHVNERGQVMARNAVSSAPCKPIADDRFLSVSLCEGCHNQHQTTDQWRASEFAAKGQSCNDCHMPQVDRSGGKRGRHHGWSGAHDLATLKAAATMTACIDGGELVLSLHNHGAGHNFPTEERHRAVDLLYSFADGDGKRAEGVDAAGNPTDFALAYRFRQPYRDESGDNTQLPSGATKEVRVPIPADAVSVTVRLWYRLQPYVGDDHPASSLLDEKVLEIR
ncbi:MAG: multiheme c-type cytochrome [Planctomycetota bacterium]